MHVIKAGPIIAMLLQLVTQSPAMLRCCKSSRHES